MANVHSEITKITPDIMEALGRHPLAWKPEDFSNPDDPASAPEYVTFVDKDGVAEVAEALQSFKGLGLDGDAISKDNFPLPTLRMQLDQACQDVHQGRGFSIVRGLDPDAYTAEDNLMNFLGVAAYIGDIRGVQDRQGSILTHVTQAKSWTTPPRLRHGIHTTSSLSWHTDWGIDILSLHVRALADKGGDTFLASSWTICNELMRAYPNVLESLLQPSWPVQVSGSPVRHILMPLVRVYQDKIYFAVDPGRLGLHPATARVDGNSPVPELSSDQRHALEILSGFASKYRLRLDMKPGDMVFINNWALLHARDSYVDSEEGQRRHLVRLWLRNSSIGWTVPESMKAPWEAAFGPKGDGTGFKEGGRRGVTQRNYPVFPSLEYNAPKYTAGSAAFVLEDSEDVNASGATEADL